ncbi:short-chain dehydrogenase [Gordoniibacillus kamchatkensis]|uniref:Short-chain dehydrogenase n=1 Tax=Gordoniibacillus kamchatkensis TaxID=1590651 RepID=A0ABR5AHH8_9BACL|nr:SDR family oxidoreductase [Paenibacillus sp. VKM B-2647]KIL40501.1 short-chain dehydrogenase [Paenibacillus sp. VKM B-2647]
MSLSGKVAVVTGAGTGIGKGVAIELAKRGVKVAISYNSSDAGANDTRQRIEEIGGESVIVRANVAIKQEIDDMVNAVADHFGGIDILVNNAALQLNYNFEHSDEQYDRMMNINLKGYWQCMQAVVPYMKAKQSGRIINISSVHGKRPTDFDTVYSMTKGGIKMLGREAAIELAKYGITVNTIEPGAVNVGKQGTKETKPIVPAEAADRLKKEPPRDIRKKFPLGRVGLPKDVGSLVCYLASDETEFLTGAAIRLDGASMLL